ncbi:AAA family ATPase [Thalassobacillus pellis]|uniref:AAA family ATPase n=1 Tax=Thalassobacillus pellis TaxID=748008 RepID=UPI00196043D4|nr:AAA family ATPase [Thalassobacillus pellis]MBM7553065.1 guanylate kinase [Thalassobacillus pellis]
MKANKDTSIYIISGPCGVGKSTIARQLANGMEQVVLVEGDLIHSMFVGTKQPEWEGQLTIVWENLLAIVKNFINNDLHVIIDYVVEDELDWFCRQLENFDASIYYVVLRAERDTLVSRLQKRGSTDLIERSLFLLNKLENMNANKPYLYDTTGKLPLEITNDLAGRSQQFRISH